MLKLGYKHKSKATLVQENSRVPKNEGRKETEANYVDSTLHNRACKFTANRSNRRQRTLDKFIDSQKAFKKLLTRLIALSKLEIQI
jgi:hypothetical protein